MSKIPKGSKKFLYVDIDEKFLYDGITFTKTTQDLALSNEGIEERFDGNVVVKILLELKSITMKPSI